MTENVLSDRSEWHNNRFIRGSYSYYSTRSLMKDGEILRTTYAPNGVSDLFQIDEICLNVCRFQEFNLLVKLHTRNSIRLFMVL